MKMVHKLNVFEIKKSVFIEISKEDFERYESVRVSGKTNMFDLVAVEDLSGLDRDKIKAIILHYDELDKLYPDVKKKVHKVIFYGS